MYFDRFDEELDLDSGITLEMKNQVGVARVQAVDTNAEFTALSLPNLCGHIYGILYMFQNSESRVETTRHNNFAVDTITLQCHENGE